VKRYKILEVSLLIGCLVLFSKPLLAKSVSLSTYYPAPFGAYDRLKLVPRDSLTLDPHCNDQKDVGTLYFDNGLNKLTAGIYFCQMKSEDEFFWVLMGVPSIKGSGPLKSGKVICVKRDDSFGICASSPSFDGTCACH